jgi:hypothetical protein
MYRLLLRHQFFLKIKSEKDLIKTALPQASILLFLHPKLALKQQCIKT